MKETFLKPVDLYSLKVKLFTEYGLIDWGFLIPGILILQYHMLCHP